MNYIYKVMINENPERVISMKVKTDELYDIFQEKKRERAFHMFCPPHTPSMLEEATKAALFEMANEGLI